MLCPNALKFIAVLFAFLLISSCEKTPEPPEDKEIEEVFEGIEGKYFGGWTSVTESTSFTDYPVSAIFRYTSANKTSMKGEFFATVNYMSCCDKDNDGTMTFSIEDDILKNWNFDDKIVGCEGKFSGEGTIKSPDKLIFTFTGNDCDGNHVGTLTFQKK